jgi:hypothetical protein
MNWIFKKLYFSTGEYNFTIRRKRFVFILEGLAFEKNIRFALGKTDLNTYDFGISIFYLFTFYFKGWKGPEMFGGYPYLTFHLCLLGMSLYIACEDTREDKQRENYIKEKGHVLDQEL